MSCLSKFTAAFRGPRLILAPIAITLLFFSLKQPTLRTRETLQSSDSYPVELSTHTKYQNETSRETGYSQTKESVSDRLFNYLHQHMPSLMSGSGIRESTIKGGRLHQSSSAGYVQQLSADTRPAQIDGCAHLPDVSDILVVIQTPASDLYQRIPLQYLTTLRCVDSVLFSTVSSDLGGFKIHDSLSYISAATKEKEQAFKSHEKVLAAQSAGLDASPTENDDENSLDKWSLIPSVLAAFEMHPDKQWFLLIESDSYVSMPNLASWVRQMDASTAIYAGAQVLIGATELANSGAGILLSRAALQSLAGIAPNRTLAWEQLASQSCCGDLVLAQALKEANVSLHRSFPLLQGETPFGLDWNKERWCTASVTWHGMSAMDMDKLWQLEHKWVMDAADANRGPTPLLFKDVFRSHVLETIRQYPTRSRWDNLADSYTYTATLRSQFAHVSVDACRAACDLRDECLQFAWEPNKCRLGTVVRIGESIVSGREKPSGNRDRLVSGWMVSRIERWMQHQDSRCERESAWLLPEQPSHL